MFASAFVAQEREARRRRHSGKRSSSGRLDDINGPARVPRFSARTGVALRQEDHVVCGRFRTRSLFTLSTLEQPVTHRLPEKGFRFSVMPEI